MPYKDPARRKEFQREYKARWRKKQEIINPLRAFKVYICIQYPFLWVGPVGRQKQFVSGFLVTDDATVIRAVEKHEAFGRFIFPLSIDLTGPTVVDDDE